MSNQIQTKQVGKVLEMEKNVNDLTVKLNQAKGTRFKNAPSKPVKQVATFEEVKLQKFWAEFPMNIILICASIFVGMMVGSSIPLGLWGTVILCLVFPIVFPILTHKYLKKAKQKNLDEQLNSDEYKQSMQANKDKQICQQTQFDEQYIRNIEEYNRLVLEWEKEKAEWGANKERIVNEINSILEPAKLELIQFYAETKIVPERYRSISALSYIYNTISTSNFDVNQAIEMYDRELQRNLDKKRLEEQRRANELSEEANELSYQNAVLQADQNEIAEKARRDANIASAARAVQHHNTNKMLKNNRRK